MEYLLKASAVIAIFYLCYKLFLQRDTFFESNRGFLLLGLITAFLIPFVVIPIYIEYTPTPIPNYPLNGDFIITENPEKSFNIFEYLPLAYLLGVVLFTIRLLFQFLSLVRIIFNNKGEKQGKFRLVKTSNTVSPFSFFNWIVYNPKLFNINELELIITHEKIHVKQYHSIDILITQLACIVLWFNPFIWLYNKDLKQNLEFIADQNAQRKSECKKSYQHTLLKTSMPTHQLALSNNFYNSLIKKRIVMLQKSKSKKRNLFKYALILPCIALFLMSYNTEDVYVEKPTLENETENKNLTNKIAIITKNHSDSELNTVKKELADQAITVVFSEIWRNSKNEIIQLTVKVKNDKGSGGATWKNDDNPIPNIEVGEVKDGHVVARTANNYISKKKHLLNNLNSNKAKPTINPKNNKAKNQNKKLKQDIENYKAIITKDFTDADFKKIINEAKTKEITLKFKKIKRNSKNEIIAIDAEFKNKKGSGNFNLNGKDPIKSFAYKQNDEGFGFGTEWETKFVVGRSMSNVKVIGYGDAKFEKDNKLISNDSIIFVERENMKNGIAINNDSIHKGPWKVTMGVNAVGSSNSLFNVKNATVIKGDNYLKSFNFARLKTSMLDSSNVSLYGIHNKNIIYILDDVEISENQMYDLDKDKIASMTVLKNHMGVTLYGNKAKNGVIIIKSKDKTPWKISIGHPASSIHFSDTLKTNNNKWKISSARNNNLFVTGDTIYTKKNMNKSLVFSNSLNHPLYIVNGIEITKDEFEKIDENEIYSISVLKDKTATRTYGEKGENGVLLITMKGENTQKHKAIKLAPSALYIVDGKKTKEDKIKDINPNDIESINVLKGDSAIEKYGKKAKDGVIEITTKKKN